MHRAHKSINAFNVLRSLWVAKLPLMVALGGLLICTSGCVTSVNVPLVYKPTNASPTGGGLGISAASLYVAPVQDWRPDQKQIGANREHATAIPAYSTDATPTQFVHDVMVSQLPGVGVRVVKTLDEGDRILLLGIKYMWVEETSRYEARITLQARVQDRTGATLWSGDVEGADSTFGRSLNPEDYTQVLSNAMLQVCWNLAGDPGFAKSMQPSGGSSK